MKIIKDDLDHVAVSEGTRETIDMIEHLWYIYDTVSNAGVTMLYDVVNGYLENVSVLSSTGIEHFSYCVARESKKSCFLLTIIALQSYAIKRK